MSNRVLLKKSSVLGKVPLATDLTYGELAINYADGKLYYKNTADQVKTLGGGTAGGTLIVGSRSGPVSVTISGGSFLVGTRTGSVSISI